MPTSLLALDWRCSLDMVDGARHIDQTINAKDYFIFSCCV